MNTAMKLLTIIIKPLMAHHKAVMMFDKLMLFQVNLDHILLAKM
jgi:hypothetical protein